MRARVFGADTRGLFGRLQKDCLMLFAMQFGFEGSKNFIIGRGKTGDKYEMRMKHSLLLLTILSFALFIKTNAGILDNYDRAWTAYVSFHYNRKQIVEVGASITPGLVIKREYQPNHYIGYVDIGLLNKLSFGISGVKYGLGVATGSPFLGAGLYGCFEYAWKDNGNLKRWAKWFYPKKGFYLGYGITGSFLLNAAYERVFLFEDFEKSKRAFSIGMGW